MRLKEIMGHPCGFGEVFSMLEIQSAYARACLLEEEMMADTASLLACHRDLRASVEAVRLQENRSAIDYLLLKLQSLKDIRTTLSRLGSGETLDDIELYEVKFLGMLSMEVREQLAMLQLSAIADVPDLEWEVNLLDPDGLRIATFCVYDSYSEELARCRAESRRCEKPDEELFLKINALETSIRERLSSELRSSASRLYDAQQALARTDILLAKARQLLSGGWCIPEISEDTETVFRGLFHPEVKAVLASAGKDYQPVDIAFDLRPTLIVGANMGGKTVVLKAVALCQFLCQFGFGVPAAHARIALMDEIRFCIGDHQSVTEGLSSFAAEIRQMDSLLAAARHGGRLLALLDEPARTTNPVEGTALVSGLLDVLRPLPVCLLVATHYAIPSAYVDRCLKVKGLDSDGRMDYTLEEVKEGMVPLEALRVARQLGIDMEWIRAAEAYLSSHPAIFSKTR